MSKLYADLIWLKWTHGWLEWEFTNYMDKIKGVLRV